MKPIAIKEVSMLVVDPSDKLNRLLRYVSDENPDLATNWHTLSAQEFEKVSYTEQAVLIQFGQEWSYQLNQQQLIEKLGQFKTVVVFYEKAHIHQLLEDFLSKLVKKSGNIIGMFDIQAKNNEYTVLLNMLKYLGRSEAHETASKRDLIKLNNEIQEVTDFVNTELIKIKKIHDKIYPPKLSNIKGLKLVSKYEAGISSGGEFFDVIKDNQKIIFILSSCDSYLKTSSLMSLISVLKEKRRLDDASLVAFVASIEKQFDYLSLKDTDKNHLLLAVVNLSNFECLIHSFGRFGIISDLNEGIFYGEELKISKINMARATHKRVLSRGEKIYILSPGIINNWKSLHKDVDLSMFIKDHIEVPEDELMSELFYQLKKNSASEFLDKDSTVVCMEVGQNVIAQI
ncbi:MAG: hypothetical protein JNM93_12600 [Bacteriovoracaceae bacterium]|nr:hypothetical protein [Bacteriovoracaceae bacterium]